MWPRLQAVGVDMEEEFLNLGLDIIGLGVFNYDFGSITTESPVIKSVYGLLKEAEHRSTFYIPYWDLPLARCAPALGLSWRATCQTSIDADRLPNRCSGALEAHGVVHRFLQVSAAHRPDLPDNCFVKLSCGAIVRSHTCAAYRP